MRALSGSLLSVPSIRRVRDTVCLLLLLSASCWPLVARAACPFACYDLQYVSGNSQIGAPNSTLSSPLTVQIQPEGDIGPGTLQILWSVLSGSATIVESGGTTYSQSVAYNGITGNL
ncbi:MAG: hypothetical protein KGH80_06475, partial [Xanthomonadaceae bacterium]|nr:hypothetical protein [Xanthomonadaceae bacterium]